MGTGLCLLQDFFYLCDFRCFGFPKVQGLIREPCICPYPSRAAHFALPVMMVQIL